MGRPVAVKAPASRVSEDLPSYHDDPPQPSSVSAHSLQSYHFTDEPGSGLPAYSDDPDITTNTVDADGESLSQADSFYSIPGGRLYTNRSGSKTITLAPALSKDGSVLHAVVLKQSHIPPKPIVHITGTHSVVTKDSKGKETRKNVTDFAFKIDPGETLLRPTQVLNSVANGQDRQDAEERLRLFRTLKVVEDKDKAWRGGRLKAKAPGWKKPTISITADTEAGDVETGPVAPHLGEWCTRFCNDPATTKTFSFVRNITAWETAKVTNALTSHIRATNYRGHITIHYTIEHSGFKVYSPSNLNKLRTNKFVWWICVILQLWIITWPILWFVTRRYEVVSCEWPYSVEVEMGQTIGRLYATGMGEEEWAETWKEAVQRAAVGRRSGHERLTESDIRLAEEDIAGNTQRSQDRQQATSGRSGFVNAIVGIANGLGDARAEYDRRIGWGGDE